MSWWSTQRLHIIFLFAHERQPILHTSIPQHPSLIHSPSIIYNRPMCHLKLSRVTIYFCRMTSPKSKDLTKWQKVQGPKEATPRSALNEVAAKWNQTKLKLGSHLFHSRIQKGSTPVLSVPRRRARDHWRYHGRSIDDCHWRQHGLRSCQK